MELAKKPVRFLFNGDSSSFKISVPGTEHHYRFYKKQPYLVKFDSDIEFFDKHLMFDRVDNVPGLEDSQDETVSGETTYSGDSETITEDSTQEIEEERPSYSKKELQKMKKSDIRAILKELSPEKSCPVRKENIIKEILKAQEAN